MGKPVSETLSFSVFTPYYSETVLYSTSELQKENEDGISTLFYLQKIFPELNFALFTQKNTNTMLYFGIFKGTMTTTQSYSNETRRKCSNIFQSLFHSSTIH
ncbi:putative 1,3-beta-glucan synthase [Medicago truncatula]|uniref:Putative 1,3-beta-glucan synthase n=1 Tax=Medicago truncatula TaxID=3880 RepID=A0A396GS50_MEDTR|nr:uncharacterized protein LOC120577339 [Medicago truncatula]RHN41517.1 putative 1,3-beta-glucan synthase [Medicago truncatula]